MSYWDGQDGIGQVSGIGPNSLNSIMARFVGTGMGTPANSNWPTANKALFVPFAVQRISIARKATWGSAIGSGNVDAGIYNAQGVRLTSSGSTAESGNPQTIDFTDVKLFPGLLYFMAMARNGTGGVCNMIDLGSSANARYMGMREMATAFPLPATATFAQYSHSIAPGMGILFENISA